jgi:ADP-heptose:LPS heptosyltransferase
MEKNLNTTFALSGGAGRIIAAIPALEKYAKLNPCDDFKVIIYGWENLYWNHPLLQNKTYSVGQKGIFDLIIKNSILESPEPYHMHSYYNQKTSLAEAFDEEINKTTDHSDLSIPHLYCHSNEIMSVQKLIDEAKQMKKKKKFVVFQPYGSGMSLVNNRPLDPSNRSLDVDDALKLAQLLDQDAVVLYFGPNEYIHPHDKVMMNTKNMNTDLRFYMAMISQCDYFLGVDSVGQHMARAFDKKGLVIMGSTFEKNVSYPDHFEFYRNPAVNVHYNPIRIGGVDCEMADRLNDGVMKFKPEQIQEIYLKVKTCLKD